MAFFQEQVFPESRIWLAEAEGRLIDFGAVKSDWLDHFYVYSMWHGRGVGAVLLAESKREPSQLSLWVFQRNTQARCFYESHGSELVALTDGSGNEEKEPDAQYRWTGQSSLAE